MVKRLFMVICMIILVVLYIGYVSIASLIWFITGKPVDMFWIDEKWNNLERKYKW